MKMVSITRHSPFTADLFADAVSGLRRRERLGEGAVLLRGFLNDEVPTLWQHILSIAETAPFRHLATPGGKLMSVAMTNCGAAGWTSDAGGYRYSRTDPRTGKPWPAMPPLFLDIAQRAAQEAGYDGFTPDACLINRYLPEARLTLHQDDNERNAGAPIVSVSLGLPAVFLFGGLARSDKTARYRLEHGDIAVWGGPSRLCHHGILPLADGIHPLTGRQRINLTFRKAL